MIGNPEKQPGRALRFVLTGTYNSCNKGDAAMELGALQGIAQLYPGSEVTILSPFPDLDLPFYAPVAVERCNRRQLVRGTWGLLRAFIWRALAGERTKADWLLGPEFQRVRDADLVVDLSGDMLTEDYGVHVAYSHYIPLLRARVLGRPYVVCAQSIGPFRYTRWLARYLLNGAATVTTRDAISRDYLQRIGVSSRRVEWTADLAFLMTPAPAERADAILRTEGLVRDGRPILGVSVSRLIESHYRSRNPGARSLDFLAMMKHVIERTARKHSARVVLVPHVTGPTLGKDDRLISAALKELLGQSVTASSLIGDYRPEELKAIIGRCSVFLGARMHANIAALSSCVPTVALSYSHKTPGIMSSCGVGEFVAPIETASEDSLGSLVSRAFADRRRDLRRPARAVEVRTCAGAAEHRGVCRARLERERFNQ
jgi:colanic acid/amylovoran biosynthesis protein